jgi:hypothetical protein
MHLLVVGEMIFWYTKRPVDELYAALSVLARLAIRVRMKGGSMHESLAKEVIYGMLTDRPYPSGRIRAPLALSISA